ncbi:hypothetical protein ACNUDN_01537 [Mycobacterium sp. smrl_JER01]
MTSLRWPSSWTHAEFLRFSKQAQFLKDAAELRKFRCWSVSSKVGIHNAPMVPNVNASFCGVTYM